MESNKVTGVVSLAEIKNIDRSHDQTTQVTDIMLSLDDTMVISPETSLIIAMRKMLTENIARLLVMENDQLLGMITKTGLMRFLEIKNILEESKPSRNISHQ